MASVGRNLRIPKSFHGAFADLLQLEDRSFNELVAAFEQASPTLFRGDLAAFVAERVTLNRETTQSIVKTLVNLYIVRRDGGRKDAGEFAAEVREALRAEDDPRLKAKDSEWDVFSRRLETLLGFENSIGITSKALEVMWRNQRVFCDDGARMVSDVRPIFKDDATKSPVAAVVVHTLKISYHEEGEIREFYVALDTKDLLALRKLLQREEEKLESLKEVLNVQYLQPESH